jgi:hypothetical protein
MSNPMRGNTTSVMREQMVYTTVGNHDRLKLPVSNSDWWNANIKRTEGRLRRQGMIGHSNLIGAYVSRPEPIK